MQIQDRTFRKRLPEGGKIRLGVFENGHPTATKHFILTSAPKLAAALGNAPAQIEFIFPFPDIEDCLRSEYAVWGGGRPGKGGFNLCRGDGRFVWDMYPHEVGVTPKGAVSVKCAAGGPFIKRGVVLREFPLGGETFKPGQQVHCPGSDFVGHRWPICAACAMKTYITIVPTCLLTEGAQIEGYILGTGSWGSWEEFQAAMHTVKDLAGGVISGVHFLLKIVEKERVWMDAKTGMRCCGLKPACEIVPLAVDYAALVDKAHARVLRQLPGPDDVEVDGEVVEDDEEEGADDEQEQEQEATAPASQRPYPPEIIRQAMRQRSGDWFKNVLDNWSDALKGDTEKRRTPTADDYKKVVTFLGLGADVVASYLFDTTPDDLSAGEIGAMLGWIEKPDLARKEAQQIVALAARELAAQGAGGEPGEE